MADFDKEAADLLKEYLQITKAIEDARATKRQCDEGIAIASKYIGEIKGQLIELMNSNGVVAAEVGNHLVSRKRKPPALLIDNVDLIPNDLVKVERRPVKAEIVKALKTGRNINGVSFSEAGETIQIKGK